MDARTSGNGGDIPLDTASHQCYNSCAMDSIIKDKNFKMVAGSVKPDSKHRVGLSKIDIPDGVTFCVYLNEMGQIVLDPQVTIPASELWLFENKEALASVHKGLLESAAGDTRKRGSFAKYVKDEA
jgi:hypothetical protein